MKTFQELALGWEAELNEATIVNVLPSCSLICSLSSGQQVHSDIITCRNLMVKKIPAWKEIASLLTQITQSCMSSVKIWKIWYGYRFIYLDLECKDIISWEWDPRVTALSRLMGFPAGVIFSMQSYCPGICSLMQWRNLLDSP